MSFPFLKRLNAYLHISANVTYDIEVGDPRGYIIPMVEKYSLNYMFMGSRSYSGIAGYASLMFLVIWLVRFVLYFY
jgi:hypothetical protein